MKLEDVRIKHKGFVAPEDEAQLIKIVWSRQQLLLGERYALPLAARGVYCDIDTRDANSMAQRVSCPNFEMGFLT